MFRLLLLPLTLLLGSSSAYSQPTSVTLSVRQAQRLTDSLAVLPLVRREAAAWRQASQQYATAADSLGQAVAAYRRASQAQQAALASQQQLLAAATADGQRWRQRARHRGLLNWLGLAVLTGAGYGLLTR